MDLASEARDDGEMSGTDHDLEAMSDEGRRLWAAALAVNRSCRAVTSRPPLPPLLFFTDPERTPEPWRVAGRLPAGRNGAAGVVYRHFGAADARETAQRLREVTALRGVRLLIGQDADLAEAVGADGTHLPQRDLWRAPELRRRMPGTLITGAFHAGAELDEAVAAALDALVVSPVFSAGGGSPKRPSLGPEGLAALAAALPLPVYGLGGVDAETAQGLIDTGAGGLAAVDGIVSAFGE